MKVSPGDMQQESDANLLAVESKELAEGLEFKDSGTYVLLEISLQKPLIPRRTDAVLAERYVHVWAFILYLSSLGLLVRTHLTNRDGMLQPI